MEYIPRLKKKYNNEVIKNLRSNYKSIMQVPKLVKICLNQGIGKASSDKKQIEAAQQEMTLIAGQKAMLTKASKDISNFKLRKGMPVGVMVTLRGNQMYEFLDRFITSTMPRIRDFNGISEKGFDGRGNYTMGIKEQIAFPEISIDKISNITGMDVTFVTSTNSDTEALEFLRELGLPFKQNDASEKARDLEIEKQKAEKRKEAEEQAKLKDSIEENNNSNVIEDTENQENMVPIEDNKNSDNQDSNDELNDQNVSEESDKIKS